MQAHPDSQWPGLPPRFSVQRQLGVDRGLHCIVRSGERGVRAVAPHLDDVPTVRIDHLAEDLVVPRQRDPHLVREVLPQARRFSQIRKEKRHRACRQPAHEAQCPIGTNETTNRRPYES